MANVNLLPSLNGTDDLPEDEQNTSRSPAEDFYVASNRTLLSLATMCISLCDDNGSAFLDLDASPWKSMKKKLVKPAVDNLKAEVLHHWNTFVSADVITGKEKDPRPKHWDKKELMKWLHDHPITADKMCHFYVWQ